MLLYSTSSFAKSSGRVLLYSTLSRKAAEGCSSKEEKKAKKQASKSWWRILRCFFTKKRSREEQQGSQDASRALEEDKEAEEALLVQIRSRVFFFLFWWRKEHTRSRTGCFKKSRPRSKLRNLVRKGLSEKQRKLGNLNTDHLNAGPARTVWRQELRLV